MYDLIESQIPYYDSKEGQDRWVHNSIPTINQLITDQQVAYDGCHA
jgi:hypothetical protein